jgi:hypothetical protein
MIPIEQPPSSTDAELANYLVRMFGYVNQHTTHGILIEPSLRMPEKAKAGMVRFFPKAIPPGIPTSGVYFFNGIRWEKLTAPLPGDMKYIPAPAPPNFPTAGYYYWEETGWTKLPIP